MRKYMPLPALSAAVLDGDEESVARLLETGADPNELSWEQLRPLHWSCSGSIGRRATIVQRLLRARADPNATNAWGSTAMHYACYGGHIECVRVLLEEGRADVTLRDAHWRSAREDAAHRGHVHILGCFPPQGRMNVAVGEVAAPAVEAMDGLQSGPGKGAIAEELFTMDAAGAEQPPLFMAPPPPRLEPQERWKDAGRKVKIMNATAHCFLAGVPAGAGASDKVRDPLVSGRNPHADLANAAKERGNAAHKAKKYHQAVSHVRESANASLLFASRTRNYDVFHSCQWQYTEAIMAESGNSVLYCNRSAAYHALGSFKEALDDAQKCLELKPHWSKGYYRKGNALVGLGRLEEAIVSGYDIGLRTAEDDATRQSIETEITKVTHAMSSK